MNDKQEKLTKGFWNELIGKQLSSVEFVQDYLQLRFDGPFINVTNPLTVKSSTREITSWNAGFRDLLCEQITKIVIAIQYEAVKSLTIKFDNSTQLVISLLAEDYSSPEAIFAGGFKNNKWIAE